jgi:hypothetical protein
MCKRARYILSMKRNEEVGKIESRMRESSSGKYGEGRRCHKNASAQSPRQQNKNKNESVAKNEQEINKPGGNSQVNRPSRP